MNKAEERRVVLGAAREVHVIRRFACGRDGLRGLGAFVQRKIQGGSMSSGSWVGGRGTAVVVEQSLGRAWRSSPHRNVRAASSRI